MVSESGTIDNIINHTQKVILITMKTFPFQLINLSSRCPELNHLCPRLLELGWPDTLAPPLERLVSLCRAADNWLSKHPSNVLVWHCKGGANRIATLLQAYNRYMDINAR